MKKVWNGTIDYQLQNKNLGNLRKFLNYILTSKNKFYQNKFAVSGFTSFDKVKTWADFQKLPFTTREELIQDQNKYPPNGTNLSTDITKFIYFKASSGTSYRKRLGTIYTEKDFQGRINSPVSAVQQLLNPKPGETLMCTYPQSAYLYSVLLMKEVGYRIIAPDLTEVSSKLLESIITSQVTHLLISPTQLIHVMEEARKRGINLKKETKVKIIIAGGEYLQEVPIVHSLIEKEWGAPCLSVFGSTEGGYFAQECLKGRNGVHLINDMNIYEIIDPETGKASDQGELVITTLWRRDFPFIRYKTGDYLSMDFNACRCGYNSPRIKRSTTHRLTDIFYIRDRKFLAFQFEVVIRNIIKLDQFEVFIYSEDDKDEIEVYIEMTPQINPIVIYKLKVALKKFIGFSPHIRLVLPDILPRQIWKATRVIDRRNKKKSLILPENTYEKSKIFYIKKYLHLRWLKYLCYITINAFI